MSAPRLPYGGSLIGCVHRLARLQLTREMRPRPRPAGVSPADRAIDHLVVAARRVARLGALAAITLGLVGLLGACATPGRVTVAPAWAPKLTASERTEAAKIERIAADLCAWALAHGAVRCVPPAITVVSELGHGVFRSDANYIVIPRGALGPDAPKYQPVVAHELAHAFYQEARCGRPEPRCEEAANFYGAVILHDHFGYTEHAAIRAMWEALAGVVMRDSREPDRRSLPGHPDSCRELHAFEARTKITPQYPCQERQP